MSEEKNEPSTLDRLNEGAEFYLASARVKSNGVHEIPSAVFYERLEKEHGVTKDSLKVHYDALEFEESAATLAATSILEAEIAKATPEQLADEDFRKGMKGVVRMPTYGGSTEVIVKAERHTSAGFGSNERNVSYGHVTTNINKSKTMFPQAPAEAERRIKAQLGIKD